jgi:hypothetical protein
LKADPGAGIDSLFSITARDRVAPLRVCITVFPRIFGGGLFKMTSLAGDQQTMGDVL